MWRGQGGRAGECSAQETGGFPTNISTICKVHFYLRKLQNHQSVENASACIFDRAIYHEHDAEVAALLRSGGVVKPVLMKNTLTWRDLWCVRSFVSR